WRAFVRVAAGTVAMMDRTRGWPLGLLPPPSSCCERLKKTLLFSWSDAPGWSVGLASSPDASRRVAPPASDTDNESSTETCGTGPAVYVPVAVVELVNGVMVTTDPSLSWMVRLPPARDTGRSKVIVIGIWSPGEYVPLGAVIDWIDGRLFCAAQ